MSTVSVKESGLNVEYVRDFINVKEADDYLRQLKELPFYQPTLKIRGKSFKPNRYMLGYGDPGLIYAFGGTEIPAEPWTPLMLELRNRVEKHVGCSFNYVLLNLYPDGTSFVNQHRDNETGIDVTFPTSTLSFGAERIIDFLKPNTPPTSIKLEHGSLFTMQRPTNKLFTHGIAADPAVTEMRISLTFRHLLPVVNGSPLKKPRLETEELKEKQSLISSNDKQSDSVINFLKQEENSSLILAEWSLNWNTILLIVLDKKLKMKIHIRVFKESSEGELRPTKQGICMSPKTWNHFQRKIRHLKFESVNETFVSNNQLLLACVNEKFCVLQQMFPLNEPGFFLKPCIIKLSDDQISKVCDHSFEITETIIKSLLMVQLPKLILNSSKNCISHFKDSEKAKTFFFNSIADEVIVCANELFECIGCLFNASSQNAHECVMKTDYEKFELNRQSIYLFLNMQNILKKIENECLCFYNEEFFFTFSWMDIENYISTTLSPNGK